MSASSRRGVLIRRATLPASVAYLVVPFRGHTAVVLNRALSRSAQRRALAAARRPS